MALHLTHNLAYWHMPKTGGMSVYKIFGVFAAEIGYERVLGPIRHGDVSEIPRSALFKRTLFGTIRDPWSWYHSLYQHVMSSPDGEAHMLKIGNGVEGFKAALYGMTHPLDVADLPDQFTGITNIHDDIRAAARNQYLSSGMGLYSWMFQYTYGRPVRPLIFVNTKHLTQGLSLILNLPHQRLLEVNRQNCATHRPHSLDHTEYDQEMRDWVSQADKGLISTFGFNESETPEIWYREDLSFPPSFR
jgi:hypothetical protein